MIRFTLSQLAAIAHGERQGSDVAIDEVTTDTRKVTAGCLFVALKGERFDAHDFAEQAKAAGLDCVLSVGALSADISRASGVGEHFNDKAAVVARLRELLAEHKIMTILVKGSRSAAMDEVVHAVQENGTC